MQTRGEIVSQRELPISYEDDATSLYHKVMNVAVDQLEEIMNDLEKICCRRFRRR
ncbi:MAG: hypothetical protein ACLR7N_03880 [Roseburia hominis]